MEEYATTLTLHGVSRIYSGNAVEKFIWSVLVLASVIFAGLAFTGFLKKYHKYEVYQSVYSTPTTEAFYPQITFCLSAYQPKWQALLCKEIHYISCKTIQKEKLWNKTNKGSFWSNGIFIIKQTFITNNTINMSINQSHIVSHEETNDTCVTWHFKKSLREVLFTFSTLHLNLHVREDLLPSNFQDITVAISEQNVSGIHLMPKFSLSPGDDYIMRLSKTVTIRKPKPYQSQCTFKTKQHYFPGIYNQQVCQTVSNDIKLFKSSGRTQEFTKHLFPKDILNKYGIDGRANEKEDTAIKSMNCLLACIDTTFDVNVLETKRFEESCIMNLESFVTNGTIHCLREQSTNITNTLLQYSLRLSYLHPESYTIIEEKGLYNFSELLADVGGFLGLMVGASCLSLLELVICITLMVLKRFFK